MKASELAYAARQCLLPASPGGNEIGTAKNSLALLESNLEDFESADTVVARVALARAALELSQHVIPQLTELAASAMKVSGRQAIRQACAPITRPGQTSASGDNLPDIPSGFTLPSQFDTPVGKAADALKGVATAAVGVVATIAAALIR